MGVYDWDSTGLHEELILTNKLSWPAHATPRPERGGGAVRLQTACCPTSLGASEAVIGCRERREMNLGRCRSSGEQGVQLVDTFASARFLYCSMCSAATICPAKKLEQGVTTCFVSVCYIRSFCLLPGQQAENKVKEASSALPSNAHTPIQPAFEALNLDPRHLACQKK